MKSELWVYGLILLHSQPLICVLWAKNSVKNSPEVTLSAFWYVLVAAKWRGGVVLAFAWIEVRRCNAGASSTRSHRLTSMQLWQIIYCCESQDVSFSTQLKPHHLDLCSSCYDRFSTKRLGWTALAVPLVSCIPSTFACVLSILQAIPAL